MAVASASDNPEDLSTSQKVFTMLGSVLGLLLAALDQTIVSTAGPRIQHDLQIEPGLYVWITTSYLVASTVLVPIYGKLSDMYGRRRVLLAAIGLFLLGSLACGISQTSMQLIASRALQGVGSAGLFTSAFAVVADLFPPAERGKWQGMFGAAFGLSSVIGPLMGGFITDNFGWHWAFFVNLPLGAIAIAFIIAKMPPLRRELQTRPKLDIAGAIALTIAALPLLLALSLGHAADAPATTGWPWTSWQILALFGGSAVGLVAFLVIEKRAASPIIDFKLFHNKTFAIGSLGAFVAGSAFLGAIVFLPLFMVNVVGVSATKAGLTTMPLTFGIVGANIAVGQLVSKIGSYKGLLVGSLVILVASFAMIALTTDVHATTTGMTAKMVLLGIGMGPSIPLFTLAIQNAVPPQQIGVATASATFFRQMGSTIGIAVVGTVFATSFAARLGDRMADARQGMPPQMAQMFEHRPAQGAAPAGEGDPRVAFDPVKIEAVIDQQIDKTQPPAVATIAKQHVHETVGKMATAFRTSFTDAIVNVYWLSLVIALLALVITAFLPSLPLRRAGEIPRPPPME